jgi:hypothetical protein
MLLKSRASLHSFRACFLPGRSKDLTAPRYNNQILFTAAVTRKGLGVSMYRQPADPWPLIPVKYTYFAKTPKVRRSVLTAFGCLFFEVQQRHCVDCVICFVHNSSMQH